MSGRATRAASSGSDLDLHALPTLPIDRLRELWARHFPRSSPPDHKRLLIRELAWRVQARSSGGLDAATRRLLRDAIRDAERTWPAASAATTRRAKSEQPEKEPDVEMSATAGEQVTPTDTTIATPPSSRRRVRQQRLPSLPVSTRLVRVWGGQRHEVLVLADGRFGYRDRTFATLSEVARAITGTRWSGPRFFGLTDRTGGHNASGSSDRPPALTTSSQRGRARSTSA